MPRTLNLKALAVALGLSKGQLSTEASTKAGFPFDLVAGKKLFDAEEVRRWRDGNLRPSPKRKNQSPESHPRIHAAAPAGLVSAAGALPEAQRLLPRGATLKLEIKTLPYEERDPGDTYEFCAAEIVLKTDDLLRGQKEALGMDVAEALYALYGVLVELCVQPGNVYSWTGVDGIFHEIEQSTGLANGEN